MPERARDEFRAGLLTLVAITVAATSAMILPGLLAPKRVRYEFRVPANEDIGGVDVGSGVFVAGIPVGQVVSLEDRERAGGIEVSVQIEVDPYPPIFPAAEARLVRDPISQSSSFEFFNVGSPGAGREPLADGSTVSLTRRQASEEGMLPAATREALATITERFATLQEAWPDTRPAADAIRRMREDLAALGAVAGEDWGGFREQAGALADRFLSVRDSLVRVRDEFQLLRTDVDAVRGLFAEGSDWATARERILAAVDLWKATADDRSRISDLLGSLSAGPQRIADLAGRLRTALGEVSDALDLAPSLANLTLAATEFGKLTAESYANPLRVLLPSNSPRDQRLDAIDDLSRRLLAAIETAEDAERALRALAKLEGLGGEELIQRLGDSLEGLAVIEQALWHLRSADRER